MKYALLCYTILSFINCATAQSAFEHGVDFGKQGKNAASGAVNDTNSALIPGYSNSPNETNFYQDGRGTLGNYSGEKISRCAQNSETSLYNKEECDAVNYLQKSPLNKNKILIDTKNDPLIKGLGETRKASSSTSTTRQICDVVYPANSTIQTQYCADFIGTENNYSCDRTLNVTCEPLRDGCDNGGIEQGSTQGDMSITTGLDSAGNYQITFGTIGNNYWCGWGLVVDRSMTFSIKDVNSLNVFKLSDVWFDDYLWIKVNGNTAYVGPYGGNKLEIVEYWGEHCDREDGCYPVLNGSAVDYGTGTGELELRTEWHFSTNVDLKPFLVNGHNTIWTRTIVGGCGENATRFTARMHCPRSCTERWDDQCVSLRSKVK
jgi:hypothetical protein